MPIRKRPNSRFFQYRFKHNGVVWAGSTKETERGKALKFEALLRARVIKGELKANAPDIPTLRVWADTFLAYVRDSQSLTKSTKKGYRNGTRLLLTTKVAGMKLDEIGTHDADLLKWDGGGPSKANQALRALSRMLSEAASRGLIKSAPTIPLRKEKKRKAILSEPWQEDILLEIAPASWRDLLVVGLETGMRPDEYTRLRWEHVLWADRQIRVDQGKTDNAERFTILTAKCADVLRSRKRVGEWVFPSRNPSGHALPVSVSDAFIKLRPRVAAECVKRGLPTEWLKGLVLYSLRHTFATRFQEATGGNRAKLAAVLGHSSPAISDRYTHPSTGEAAADMDAWDAERRKVVKFERRA